ncbi:hypothetical protein MJD09_22040, partial [bacterium]|nr:hypothetical protein [bacterium]
MNKDFTLYLKSGAVLYEENLLRSLTLKPTEPMLQQTTLGPEYAKDIFDHKYYLFIQFRAIPIPEQMRQIRAAGIELLDYLPNYTYLASFSVDLPSEALKELDVRGLYSVAPFHKIDPSFEALTTVPEHAVVGRDRIKAVLSYPQNLTAQEVERALSRFSDITIEERKPRSFYIVLTTPFR